MITTPTTLILGAGASYPYGFPLERSFEDRLELFPREYIERDIWFLKIDRKLSLEMLYG